jgi:hypothetical protein
MTPTPGLTRARDLAMAAETMTGSLGRTPARRTLTLAHLDGDALSAADVAQVLHYAEAAAHPGGLRRRLAGLCGLVR